uniref:Uncharacterized protein n=1 Tax=Neobacillus citreus TaxID=2833578 RepID=A0A942T7H1_9BACI
MSGAAPRWEQQGPKSWTAKERGVSLGIVLRVGDRFLAFDRDNRPLGSEQTLESAQQLVVAEAPAGSHRRDTVVLALSVLAALVVAVSLVLVVVRTLE